MHMSFSPAYLMLGASLTPNAFHVLAMLGAKTSVSVNSDIFCGATANQVRHHFFWPVNMQVTSVTKLPHSSAESHRLLDVRVPSDPAGFIGLVPKGEGECLSAFLRLPFIVMRAHLLGTAIACARYRCGERRTCFPSLPTIFPILEVVPGATVLVLVASLPRGTCHSWIPFPERRSSC